MTNNHQSSMYRQAAIDSHYMHKYGKVCMLPNMGHVVFFVCLFLLATLAFKFISTQPFFETVNITGWVKTSTSNIEVRSQESAGIVEEIFVANGSKVLAGQPIARISRSQGEVLGKQGVDKKRSHILKSQATRHAILEQNTANLLQEVKGLNEQYLQSGKQIDELVRHQQSVKNQLAISKNRWQTVKSLAEKGTVTIVQVEQSELQMLTLHQQDFELFMQLQSLQTTQANIAEQTLKNAQQQSQIGHEKSLLNIQTQQDLDSLTVDTQFTVHAPSAGIIDNIQIENGKSVSFNQILTQIAPLEPSFFVQLVIPSHQVAFMKKDQQVRIKVDGFAFQKFGSLRGTVSHISEQVIAPQDIDGLSVNVNQPVYLVSIDVEYEVISSAINKIHLRSGMSVSASISKQKTTILQWLLAPLLDLMLPQFSSQEVL